MKLKKTLSVLIALILLLVTVPTAVATETFHVSLKIHFIENFMFSKYDVNVYLNETELVTLKHGKDYSGSFDAKAGKNTLHFYRDGKKKVSGSMNFDVDEDKEISCTISCHSGEIDVSKIKITSAGKAETTVLPEPQEEDTALPESQEEDTASPEPQEENTALPEPQEEDTEEQETTGKGNETATESVSTTVTEAVIETTAKKDDEREAIARSLSNDHGLVWFGNVRNDNAGRWRLAEYSSRSSQETIALDYYKAFFKSNNEIHALINMTTKRTASITVLFDSILDVTIMQYVKGEEHDAKELFSGKTLKEYWVYMDTGKIELID